MKDNKNRGKEVRVADDLSACIFTIGEPLLQQCREALSRQTLQPKFVEMVENVSPMDEAFRVGLSKVKTKYYVSLDADMVMFPHCLEFLYSHIKKEPDALEVIAMLEDPFLGVIEGIRIYNKDVVEELGGFDRVRGPERKLVREALKRGFKRLHFKDVVGKHHPEYTIKEAFWKFKDESEKLRLHQGGTLKRWKVRFRAISEQFLEKEDESAIAAMAGLIYGLTTDMKGMLREVDFTEFEKNAFYKRIEKFLTIDRSFSVRGTPIFLQPAKMELLRQLISEKEVTRAYIYGAGSGGIMLSMLLEEIFDVSVLGFIDRDSSRKGTRTAGYPVIALEDAQLSDNVVFISQIGGDKEGIENDLKSRGLSPEKIINLNTIF